MSMWRSAALFVWALALVTPVSAQTVAVAQVAGAVTDESGGALPGAEVTAAQIETGASRFVITGSQGEYVLNNLPVGPYRLTVKLSGFSTYEQTGIVLQVGSNPTINVSLKLGSMNETIQVQADATMVETRSTSVGQVVDREQIVNLPLNGRQPTQLVLLAGAAVIPQNNLNGGQRQYPSAVAISVAGGAANSTLYLLDGGYNNDPLVNVGQPMPFPDALQEFKVESGVRPARYGMFNGATVNAVTRSGSNSYHGNIFEFMRHHTFNSIAFFDRAENGGRGVDDGLRRSQAGGTFGGPIKTDKLFFFGGVQITNERIAPTSADTFLPTAKMLAGDFTDVMSANCRGGTARTLGAPFVNNRIDPSRFDPIAMKIVGMLPVSPDPCGAFSYGLPNNSDEQQVVGRGDFQMTAAQRMFGRYFVANFDRAPGFTGEGLGLLQATGNGLGLDNRVQTATVGHDWVLTPNLFSAARFSFSHSRVLRVQGATLPTWTTLGVKVFQYTQAPGDNLFNLSVTNGWPGPAFPGHFISTTPQLSYDLDWIKSSHSLSFGAMWVRPFLDPDGPFQANGIFTFNGSRTRGATANDQNGIADFLVGVPVTFRQGGSQLVAYKVHYVGAYLQDVWRVNNRLTLNYGARWEPHLAPRDVHGFLELFNMDWFQAGRKSSVLPQAPAGLMFPGDDGFPGNGANTNDKLGQFAPRFGLVWDPAGDNVQTIRAGVGLYFESPKIWTYGRYPQNPPYGNTIEITNPSSFVDPWASLPGGNLFPIKLPPTPQTVFPLQGTYASFIPDPKPNSMTQWNISYQRQFWANWLASVSYLGNHGSNMWLARDINYADPTIPGATTGNTQARRIFNRINPTEGRWFGPVTVVDDSGESDFNGVIISLQKRMSSGWSSNANLTLSKCRNYSDVVLDITNQYPDPNDPSTNFGPCNSDRPYIFNWSTIVMTPGAGSGLVNVLTRDWQIAAVLQARSGAPLTPAMTTDNALTGLGTQRPLLTSTGWQLDEPCVGALTNNSCRWFNPAAFAPNTIGVWGDTPRGHIRGPRYWNVDMAFSRNLRFSSSRELELRVEAFNVFNHFAPGNPNVTFGNTNFGRIVDSAGDPRIMQFAVKFGF